MQNNKHDLTFASTKNWKYDIAIIAVFWIIMLSFFFYLGLETLELKKNMLAGLFMLILTIAIFLLELKRLEERLFNQSIRRLRISKDKLCITYLTKNLKLNTHSFKRENLSLLRDTYQYGDELSKDRLKIFSRKGDLFTLDEEHWEKEEIRVIYSALRKQGIRKHKEPKT
ncbi:MAG: hypothetical protein AAF696_23965 [Bacteroidota bacterium]